VIDTEVKEREGVDRNLPDGWKWVKLKEICERIDYGFTASADFSITEPRFLRITDIQNGQVNWTKVPGCKISFREEETNKLIDGDIVFARTGGTTGKSFLIKQPPRSVFASYLIRLRLNNDISAEYIYAFLQSNSYWQQIRQSARGGAQPNVNAQLLGSIILPLPPLAEQKRIVAILICFFNSS
jgi:type I restriction enzyme S subunit